MKSRQLADSLELRGVRVHNLKNISLRLPHGKVIVITGVSGSGKSSLAFDTIYAEGQRRYVETLSSYIRQFLERKEKPDADAIEGIAPSVAITQMQGPKNPRSTVATVTGIYDLLRLLFAKAGVQHCVSCGRVVEPATEERVWQQMQEALGGRTFICFLWKGEPDVKELRKAGFFRIYRDGQVVYWEELQQLPSQAYILVDRLILSEQERSRFFEAVETAFKYGDGRAYVFTEKGLKIFSLKRECPYCNIEYPELEPNYFSFNSPHGACPRCSGFGEEAVLDWRKIIPDPSKTLAEGAVVPFQTPSNYDYWMEMLEEAGIPTDVPFEQLSPQHQQWVREEVEEFFRWLETKRYKVQARVFIARYRKYIPCPQCKGRRLRPEALAVYFRGKSIGDILEMTAAQAAEFFSKIKLTKEEEPVLKPIIQEIREKIDFINRVGLGYLQLNRMSFTLSGGEWERISLAAALAASLTGIIYVLDEPSIGLHPKDIDLLLQTIDKLRSLGNTVIIVEHDPQIIKKADWIVELGPGAGEKGGYLLYSGTLKEFLKENTPTARYLKGKTSFPSIRCLPESQEIIVRGARKFNLKNITVRFLTGKLNCITGVSGAGKSTLLYEVLYKGITGEAEKGVDYDEIILPPSIKKTVLVSQHSIPRSPRATPATYIGALNAIREIFAALPEARRRGYRPSTFSFNSPGGRCEACEGAGFVKVEMYFLSDMEVRCEACGGRRYKDEVLEVKYKGLSIADVLDLTVTEALELFKDHPAVVKTLEPLEKVGLGYIRLGQRLSTLSVGEAQRLKLAEAFKEGGRGTLFLMDEPTTGLHAEDIAKLMKAIEELLLQGNTFIVIEHNLDFIARCHHIVDLGPEGGDKGGYLVASGTPAEIAACPRSHTGRFLRRAGLV